MLVNLYIGSASGHIFVDGFWWFPDQQTPAETRRIARDLHETRNNVKVWTLNPLVIRCVIEVWKEAGIESEEIYRRTFLIRRKVPGDSVMQMTRLLGAYETTWLNHFCVEDLFIRGEFDDLLSPVPKS